ncbi:MAG TPA: glycoside hydrolase family 3 N-terminal domain-containing protein [Chitinophagaceae bacterium]|nr:glycoside hydrolase family 3 N-terminal domain-containing protein [Chitinophagaceae bacterium]
MRKLPVAAFFFLSTFSVSFGQYQTTPAALRWADSVFNTLNNDERIAQLMVLRGSSISPKGVVYFDKEVNEAITKYNVGGVCLFQGPPVKQATIVNNYQRIAKTPVLICIDAEWGLGMRMDSVIPLNHQLMLGAVQDGSIIYEYGRIVGEQCKRAGIQVNYAPVVDINNNPNNPVINDRSFGEDKYKVALFGVQYMKGLQDVGVMATAKHFPGHGDVAVDSHLDLPVINKTRDQLDSLELFPFREMFKAGVASVMIAHLYIPAIDNTANRATSISKNNVTNLLKNELGFRGLTFTDALEMKGVSKFFPGGEISVQSVIAGNDMLCLPADVPASIEKIKEAISNNQLTWDDIYQKTKKVLAAKYMYGLGKLKAINTTNLTKDLNSKVNGMKRLVAENAITLLNKEDNQFFPLQRSTNAGNSTNIAYVGIGLTTDNAFSRKMKSEYDADVFYFNYKQDAGRILSTVALLKSRYKSVVIGIHNYNRYPANNFGISKSAVDLAQQLQQQTKSVTFVFGNPYAIKNFCDAKNLIACYEDDSITQSAAIDILKGKIPAKGQLPVTVCDNYKFGSGIVLNNNSIPVADPVTIGLDPVKLNVIDSIAEDAIAKGATPGAAIMVVKDGKIAYQKAFGKYDYDKPEPVTLSSVFDMASVTKICATTLSVMKLYDEGKLDLQKKLGDYLPWVKGTDKENLLIEKILLHQAGLVSYIPFYKETIDSITKIPFSNIYSAKQNDSFSIRVAENLYMRTDWRDTMYKRILNSKLGPVDKYIYSDNDFIFLGKIVEAITGQSLDQYVKKTFYDPLGLTSTGFKPRERFTLDRIVPTETEKYFRLQHLRGDVHDPGSAMFGGVAGHAGLFSTAYDLAVIMQMVLNGGTINGKQFIKPETIKLFTAYNSSISRRGLGYDKPEKDNETLKEPYPAQLVSPLTFGHTGYTGTCVWADPAYNIVYVFLSTRVNPDGGENLKLSRMNVRGKIQDQVYHAMGL